jgi:hypothetical protein
MKLLQGIAAVALCLGLAAPMASATDRTVPVPYPTVQDAVDAAVAGDVVLIAPGVFLADSAYEAGGGDTTLCTVVMKSGITIRGSGIDQTIIDGADSTRGISLSGVTGATICHLTVRNTDDDNYGCGLLLKEFSSAFVHDVKIVDGKHGGLAVIDTSSATFEDCIFDHNSGKYGAGVDVEVECEASFLRCQIINNTGPANAGAQIRGNAVLERCLIDGNSTAGASPGGVSGGGIGLLGRSPILRFCEITNNYSGGEGGGISVIATRSGALIEHCLIEGNECAGDEGQGGGLMITGLADIDIRDCIIRDNETSGSWGDGGGMFISRSDVTVSNCTFYQNTVGGTWGQGGNVAMQALDAPPTLMSIDHSIIAYSATGLGISCLDYPELMTVSCCDVYGNAGGDAICGGTVTDCFSLNPQFCSPATGNLHILVTSPCAPGSHPNVAGACDGLLIGALGAGCDSGIEDDSPRSTVALLGNQPNPFSRQTLISFSLSRPEKVELDVIDPNGRRVAVLLNGTMPAGVHEVAWDGTALDGTRAASGVYFYRLNAGGLTEAMRMLRLR